MDGQYGKRISASTHEVYSQCHPDQATLVVFTSLWYITTANGEGIGKHLKGQCQGFFCFWFFSWISFPQAPEYTSRAVSKFFENSRRYSQLKVDLRYQRHRWQICHQQYQRYRRQILPPISLVLLIPVANLPPVSTIRAANLPPVSTIPVANWSRYQRRRRQICHRCQQHLWQTMGLVSGCKNLKVNLKAKIYMYANSTIQRCPNKIFNIFLIADFFHLPPVSTTPVVNIELRISPRIFRKNLKRS